MGIGLEDAAQSYAERGWRVVPLHYPKDDGRCSCRRPCRSVGKHPRPKAWQERATTDFDKIERWWQRDPRNNVGIATGGPARLVILDVDPKDGGFDSLDELLAEHGTLPQTPTVETGSGGRHYYFAAPEGSEILRNSASKLGKGLDIRGEGGQVVAPPSMHASGNAYRWAIPPEDEDLAELPAWIVKLIAKASAPRPLGGDDDDGDGVTSGGRNDFLTRRAGMLRRIGVDEQAIAAVLNRENRRKCKPPLPESEVDRIAASVARYKPGNLPTTPDDWRNRLRPKLDRKGNPTGDYVPTRRNLCTVLEHDPKWRGRIWFDETRSQVRIGDRPISETDFVEIANDLDERYDWSKLAIGTIHEAVLAVSRSNRVDVLRDYLEGLEWDGERRVGEWLYHAIGAEWNALTVAYSRKFMIQAVARALSPGCQADSVLVLVGSQGAGKSTLFRTLAGDEWFSDTVIDLRSRDRFATIHGAWIYEFAELASFRASRSEPIKAFVTSRADTWRPPYARTDVTHRRRVVFVASTNEDEFLADYTGSRRFWPVKVAGPLNRAWLASVRDQLWAEAVVAYKAGEDWHLTREEDGWRQVEASQYQERDPWTVLVAAYVKDRTEAFTTSDVLADACKVSKDRQGFREMGRVGAILRRLHFYAVDGHKVVDGKRVACRIWRQPASVAPIQGDLIEGTPESPEVVYRPPTVKAPSEGAGDA